MWDKRESTLSSWQIYITLQQTNQLFLSIVTGGDLSLDPSTVSLPFCQSNRKEELIKSNSKKCKIFNVHRTKTNFNSDSVDLKIQETKTEKYKWWCLYKALK